MKSFLLLCILVGFAPGVSAQYITGRAILANGRSASYATASLYRAIDSSYVKATLAGAEGEFSFVGLPKGRYFVVVNAIGAIKTPSPVFSYNGDYHALDPVVMDEQSLRPGHAPAAIRRPISGLPYVMRVY
jgi:hypothetical protein